MAEFKLDIPIEESSNAFLINASAFIVVGPNPDLGLQVTFCEDLIRHRVMKVSSSSESAPAQFDFDGIAVRQVLGRMKMTLPVAKQLVDLLSLHIKKVEEAVAAAEKGSSP